MANILILSVEQREAYAIKIQEILTNSGCAIKTRLGIHDSSSQVCSQKGLIILELISEKSDIDNLVLQLQKIDGVKVKLVTI
ncbi:MAG: hypothetical protein LBI80_02095 [Endomicrobium sp.]|jgi:hypothetical protein|nr:hypothetical protein [Endomicrobium sp.]